MANRKRSKHGSVAKISVVIPVLNESKTVAQVVRFAKKSPLVGEVLVVDDGSIDGTPELASEAGARVVTASMLGKGGSMEDALQAVKYDFVVSHALKFRGERATGKITLAPAMLSPKICREHDLCKLNVLHHLAQEAGVTADRILAVGDSDNDRCMLAAAGQSVAFNPKSPVVKASARHVVKGDLRGILRILGTSFPSEPELRQTPYLDESI